VYLVDKIDCPVITFLIDSTAICGIVSLFK
jgi:hypothetical protein